MSAPHDTARLLTRNAACKRLGVGRARLQRWIKSGELPTIQDGDGAPLIDPGTLDKFLRSLEKSAASTGASAGLPEDRYAAHFETLTKMTP